MSSSYYQVVNWEQFQHYKKRNPPWIKLYGRILDDYDFSTLDDHEKFQLMALWILAGKLNNRIPADENWITARINSKKKVNLELFASLNFIELCLDNQEHSGVSIKLADCNQNARRSVSVSVSDNLKEKVFEVFNYWTEVMGKSPNRVKLTAERHKKIAGRLKTYPVADIMLAIDNCKASPHHQGKTRTNSTVFDDIELICRNDTKLEFFRDMKIQNEHSDTDWAE